MIAQKKKESNDATTDYQLALTDDSGAQILRHLAAGLSSALLVSLLALLAVVIAWIRANGLHHAEAVSKDSPRSVAVNTITPPSAAADSTASAASAAAAAAAATTVAAVAVDTEAGEAAPPYVEAVAAVGDQTLFHEERGEHNSSGRENWQEQARGRIESSDSQQQPVEVAVIEGGSGGRHRHTIHARRKEQYLRSNSGVSLKSLRSVGSVGSLGDLPQQSAPVSPSPSTVIQDDIQRLRALLDTERSRRVAAESALGSASSSRCGSGTFAPSTLSSSAGRRAATFSRSRSFTASSRSGLAHAVDPHARGTSTPPTSRLESNGGEGWGLHATPGRRPSTPTHSFAKFSSMAGTPRGSRLPHASLHKFPSARVVKAHALEAAGNAATWAQCVIARADKEAHGEGGRGTEEEEEERRRLEKEQLPSAVINILAHLFDCCRAEVRRILQVRVDGLQRFVGTTEAVVLGDCHANGSAAAGDRLGGARAGAAADAGGMAADTEELLYGELRRRYRTIAGLTRNQLVALSAGVLSHALTTKAEKEFGRMLLHQTWPLFEQVARSYLALFVECALQQPQIEFEDTAGKQEMYDPDRHRKLAAFGEAPDLSVSPEPPLGLDSDGAGLAGRRCDGDLERDADGRTCHIVFPATYAGVSWPPSDAAKSGVIVY